MRFNLDDYETVEARIKRFYEANEDGRIITEWINASEYVYTAEQHQAKRTWVIKATIYLTAGDQANDLPKSTGLAFEIDGGSGANQVAALENSETSAIGRALANCGLSGNKRASRSEMQKVDRASSPEVDWLASADKIMNVEDLRALYSKAKAANASSEILQKLKSYATALSASGESPGA